MFLKYWIEFILLKYVLPYTAVKFDSMISHGCWVVPSSAPNRTQPDQHPDSCLKYCQGYSKNFIYAALDQHITLPSTRAGTCYCLANYTAMGRSNRCDSICGDKVSGVNFPGYLCGSKSGTRHANVYQIRPLCKCCLVRKVRMCCTFFLKNWKFVSLVGYVCEEIITISIMKIKKVCQIITKQMSEECVTIRLKSGSFNTCNGGRCVWFLVSVYVIVCHTTWHLPEWAFHLLLR